MPPFNTDSKALITGVQLFNWTLNIIDRFFLRIHLLNHIKYIYLSSGSTYFRICENVLTCVIVFRCRPCRAGEYATCSRRSSALEHISTGPTWPDPEQRRRSRTGQWHGYVYTYTTGGTCRKLTHVRGSDIL